MIAVVIMAGGVGTRLFPASTKLRPKQFVMWPSASGDDGASSSGPGQSLIQQTYRRLAPLTTPDAIFIATTAELVEQVREHLPEAPPENIIIEPMRRNSAGACALATAAIAARFGPETAVAFTPSDGAVSDNHLYQETLRSAARVAQERRGIVVVGIQPQRPATGFGYIRPGECLGRDVYRVAVFEEKPNHTRALQLVEEGCLWNAGIYVWRADVAYDAFSRFLPHHARLFEPGLSSSRLQQLFEALPIVSVDVGIAERCDNIFCVAGRFGWDDLGTWDAFNRLLERDASGNVGLGSNRFVDSSHCVAIADEGQVIALGVTGLVIVRYGNTVLVCPRERAEEVGKL